MLNNNNQNSKKHNDELAGLIIDSGYINIFSQKKFNNPECKEILKIYAECIQSKSRENEKCLSLKYNIDKICKKNFLFN